jgi:putative membrane protein
MLVINALLFLWVGRLVKGFVVTDFWSALWGALIVSITNLVLNRLLRNSAAARPAAPPSRPTKPTDVIDI